VSPLLEAISQDVRYALCGFRRRLPFAATAILTLALAIGGNSAVFSMIRAVLLRPFPGPILTALWSSGKPTKKRGRPELIPLPLISSTGESGAIHLRH